MADVYDKFMIVYSDESKFCSHDGTWEDAPAQDVQFVKVFFKESYQTNTYPMVNGKIVKKVMETGYKSENIQGNDYYGKDANGNIIGTNDKKKIASGLKFGKYMADSAYDQLVDNTAKIIACPPANI